MAHFFFGFGRKDSERLTLAQFKDLYNELSDYDVDASMTEDRLIEILRKISEMIVYGEKDETLFDYFCEKNILAKFVEIVNTNSSNQVKTQIIQTMCIVIQNMKNKTSLYFVLSGNHINRLINYEYDLTDEELLANFISLMKALTLKLNPETVQFFLDPRVRPPPFHLYTRALQFVSSPDPMARTSALNMILHIFQVEDPALRSFLALEGHRRRFFAALCASLRRGAARLAAARRPRARATEAVLDRLRDEAHGLQDQFYYLEDVLSTGEPQLARALGAYTLRHFLYPVLLGGLLPPPPLDAAAAGATSQGHGGGGGGGGGEAAAGAAAAAAPEVSLFLLAQLFAVLRRARAPARRAAAALLRPGVRDADDLAKLDQEDEELMGEDQAILDAEASGNPLLEKEINPQEDKEKHTGNPYRAALLRCLGHDGGGGGGGAGTSPPLPPPPRHLRLLALEALRAALASPAVGAADLRAVGPGAEEGGGEGELAAALLGCLAPGGRAHPGGGGGGGGRAELEAAAAAALLLARKGCGLGGGGAGGGAGVGELEAPAPGEREGWARALGRARAAAAEAVQAAARGPLGPDLFLNLFEDELAAFQTPPAAAAGGGAAPPPPPRRRGRASPAAAADGGGWGTRALRRPGAAAGGGKGMMGPAIAVLADPERLLIPDENEDSSMDEIESAKRSIQAFLVLHALYRLIIGEEDGERREEAGEKEGSADGTDSSAVAMAAATAGGVEKEEAEGEGGQELLCAALRGLSKKAPEIPAGATLVLSGRDCLACTVPAGARPPGPPPSPSPGGAAAAPAAAAAAAAVAGGGGGRAARRGTVPAPGAAAAAARAAEEQLYLVLDGRSLVLAAPDRWRLEAGAVRAAARLHRVRAAETADSGRRLHLTVRSAAPVGLMWPTPGVDLGGAGAGGGPKGHGAAAAAAAAGAANPEGRLWHLVLAFESERARRIALEHLQERRRALRDELLGEVHALLVRAGAPAAPGDIGGGGGGGDSRRGPWEGRGAAGEAGEEEQGRGTVAEGGGEGGAAVAAAAS